MLNTNNEKFEVDFTIRLLMLVIPICLAETDSKAKTNYRVLFHKHLKFANLTANNAIKTLFTPSDQPQKSSLGVAPTEMVNES